MADKVIEINQEVRLTKMALKQMQESIASLAIDTVNSIVLIKKGPDNRVTFEAYGLDWETMGQTRAILETISQSMIAEDLGVYEEDFE